MGLPTSILFLDLDGVLNTHSHTNRMPVGCDPRLCLLPRLVAPLAEWLMARPNVGVVLSSDWRRPPNPGFAATNAILRGMGLPRDMVGETPQHGWTQPAGWGTGVDPPRRGREIAEWLRDHTEVEHVVCLDDGDDFHPIQRHLVRTSPWHGLQPRHIRRLDGVLAGPLDRLKL